MIEIIIGALVALALLICAFALFSADENSSTPMCSREELIDFIASLPDGARIYITIEQDGTDLYGFDNS